MPSLSGIPPSPWGDRPWSSGGLGRSTLQLQGSQPSQSLHVTLPDVECEEPTTEGNASLPRKEDGSCVVDWESEELKKCAIAKQGFVIL